MPDFDAIGVAIAARYAPAAITANGGPPAGLTNVRKSTADLPQAISAVPIVLVFPDHGELGSIAYGGGTRAGEHDFRIQFLFGLTRNLARELNACRKWLTILVDQHKSSLALGGLVVNVRTLTWRLGTIPYQGKTYTGIELGVRAWVSEPWQPT